MKKVLAGCLIVLVIALIGFGVAGYYAYRFVKPVIEDAGNYLDKAREVTRLGQEVKIKTPYTPPENGELTLSQVERFLAVQSRVRSELDSKWGEIEKKSAQIKAKAESNSNDWTLGEFTGVFNDIANIWIEGRRAQVLAINTQRFSEAEYEWVRRRVYEAAGVELAGEVDLSKIEALARDNAGKTGVQLPHVELPKVPEANLRLVKPYAPKVREWIPMAMLGL